MLVRRAVLFAGVAVALLSCSNSQPAVQKNPHTGSGSASDVAGVQQVTLTSGSDLRFHPSTFTVHQGKVEVILINTGSSSGGPPHNFSVDGFPGDYIPFQNAGDRGSVTFVAPSPGRYRFVCTIHVAEGQTGTMIVLPGS